MKLRLIILSLGFSLMAGCFLESRPSSHGRVYLLEDPESTLDVQSAWEAHKNRLTVELPSGQLTRDTVSGGYWIVIAGEYRGGVGEFGYLHLRDLDVRVTDYWWLLDEGAVSPTFTDSKGVHEKLDYRYEVLKLALVDQSATLLIRAVGDLGSTGIIDFMTEHA